MINNNYDDMYFGINPVKIMIKVHIYIMSIMIINLLSNNTIIYVNTYIARFLIDIFDKDDETTTIVQFEKKHARKSRCHKHIF